MKRIILLALAIISSSAYSYSQNEGSFLDYVVENNGKISVMSNGEHGRVQSMIDGNNQTYISNQAENKNTYLFSTKEDRVAIETNIGEYSLIANLDFTPTSVVATNETATVESYNCKKYTVSGDNMDITVWTTNDISNTYQPFKNLIGTVEGVPVKIEFTTDEKSYTIKMVNYREANISPGRMIVPNGYRFAEGEEKTTLMNTILK